MRTFRVVLVLLAALVAVPNTAEAREAPTVEQSYRRATNSAIGGAVAVVGAAPIAMGGVLLAIRGPSYTPRGRYALGIAMYGVGYVGIGAGGAMMAGSSLRAQQILSRNGAQLTAAPALVSWAAWGVSATMMFVPRVARLPGAGMITLGSYLTAYTLGVLQILLNGRAKRAMSAEELKRPAKKRFAVTPTMTRNSAGLAMVIDW